MAAMPVSDPPVRDVSQLADHLFRHESGKLTSALTALFGIERLQLVEDVVQEALLRALKTWPFYGIPPNPAAWLTQTAKNLALDFIRREKNFLEKETQIIAFLDQTGAGSVQPRADDFRFEGEMEDDRLRLMFACCHPLIPLESQTALALKTLCGFSAAEISKAFLTTEAAVAKRLTRARQRLQEKGIRFEIPSAEELPARLDGVLQTLYLLFNEGYKASTGESLIREELCREAIRLAGLLATHPACRGPRVHALLALMLLNGARLPARVDALGNILRLEDQDRSRWDRAMIARGLFYLAQSAEGAELSDYHLQAAIAAVHCAAPSYAATDWARILKLYDRLAEIDPSPIVALNRAVALGKVQGSRAGLDAIESIPDQQTLESYYLFHAVRAEFAWQLRDFAVAADHLRKAIQLTELPSERAFLNRQLRRCH